MWNLANFGVSFPPELKPKGAQSKEARRLLPSCLAPGLMCVSQTLIRGVWGSEAPTKRGVRGASPR
jgi:hypothetical protein